MLETLANKMTLADGVLDGSIVPADKPTAKAPPADPTLHFAERAAEALGQSLVHCQEAILPGDATPVLLTVLRDPTRAAAVESLFHETDWRGNPPKLQILDESTWSALQQLAAAGLITFNTRATRHLTGEAPPPQNPPSPPNNSNASPTSKPSPPKNKKSPSSSSRADLADEAEPHQKAAEKALKEAERIEKGEFPS
jgi:hypothetical protein